MRMYKMQPWLLTFFVLMVAVWICSVSMDRNVPQEEYIAVSEVTAQSVALPTESRREEKTDLLLQPDDELVGVWVPYFSLITEENNKEAFCSAFDAIAQEAATMGFNTLFVHVRPFGDALYPSSYYPWSHVLTGEQGTDPGFDPLAYMIEAAHTAGLQFHAWVNPLRISLSATPAAFSEDNPYIAWQATERRDMFLRCENGIYYDPGYAEVRDFITAGVLEIVENYDVDGIHFDDYFYPENEPDADAQSYALYLESVGEGDVALEKEEWRLGNINALVSQVYAAIKASAPSVAFGISPSGVVGNNAALSADVVSWCSILGYVDYICPQLYYSLADCPVTFMEALETWNEIPRAENVKLYIGLAVYKAGSDADGGAWQGRSDILAQEIVLGRENGAAGFVFYAWDQLHTQQAAAEVHNAFAVLA